MRVYIPAALKKKETLSLFKKIIVQSNYSHLQCQIVLYYAFALYWIVFKKLNMISYLFYEQIKISLFCDMKDIKTFQYANKSYIIEGNAFSKEILSDQI